VENFKEVITGDGGLYGGGTGHRMQAETAWVAEDGKSNIREIVRVWYLPDSTAAAATAGCSAMES
jgi:hypothetical protein